MPYSELGGIGIAAVDESANNNKPTFKLRCNNVLKIFCQFMLILFDSFWFLLILVDSCRFFCQFLPIICNFITFLIMFMTHRNNKNKDNFPILRTAPLRSSRSKILGNTFSKTQCFHYSFLDIFSCWSYEKLIHQCYHSTIK